MKRAEEMLRWLLCASGAILLTALFPAAMPFEWMQAIHEWLGMGELPDRPIVGYLTRSVSLLYAFHGALLLFISFDVRRHLPFIRCLGALSALFSVGIFLIDLAVGMPGGWVAFEGPPVLLLSVAILWLAAKVEG